ncbi:hypothetical protein [Streptomyces sp. MUSC 125]|uniref:hypothetical protein n=1 Tax=Streptomyces sp. MUSC 125 TaxID=1428624 RepID=UPI001F30872A|nr:hypothetical protein [Streptomyces sp. MUSC 125]
MRFAGLVIRTGVPLPPASGPVRLAMMHQDGVTALRESMSLYGQCCRSISLTWGLSLAHLPSWTSTTEEIYRRGLWTMSAQRDFLIRVWSQARRQLRANIAALTSPSPWSIGPPTSDRWSHRQYMAMARSLHIPHDTRQLVDPWRDLETAARTSLARAVDAYNFLEDSELSELAHRHAHHVAALVGGLFDCNIEYSDDTYWDVCRLTLMHSRWGMSAGFTATRNCSLCGQDIDYCPHLLDTQYDVTVRHDADGACNVCGSRSCSHTVGETVSAFPRSVMSEVQLHEVSWVSRPRDPLARFTKIELSQEVLRHGLGEDPTGRDVCCYRCLHPCSGFDHLPNRD